MIGTLIRELSDGEELVVEGLPVARPLDPRERAIEARRLALDQQDDSLLQADES